MSGHPVVGTSYFNCAFVGTINKRDSKNAWCQTLQETLGNQP
jgi:hypothetical protein